MAEAVASSCEAATRRRRAAAAAGDARLLAGPSGDDRRRRRRGRLVEPAGPAGAAPAAGGGPRLRPPAVRAPVRARARGAARRRACPAGWARRWSGAIRPCFAASRSRRPSRSWAPAPLRDETLAMILARVLGDRLPALARASAPARGGGAAAQRAGLRRRLGGRWHGATTRPGRSPSCSGWSSRSVRSSRASIRSRRAALRLLGLFPVEGGRRRSRRALSGSSGPGGRRRRRLLAPAPALAAGDQAPRGGPALLDRRLRLGRAPRQRRRALARRAGARRRGLRAQGPVGRSALLRPRAPARRRAAGCTICWSTRSASMRGAREVFARGLALALAKKLSLVGGRGRRSGCASSTAGCTSASTSGGPPAASCRACSAFARSAGRNYARVFARPGRRGGAAAARRGREQVALTFITHGECHIPRSDGRRRWRATRTLYGIFVLPSRPHRSRLPAAAAPPPDGHAEVAGARRPTSAAGRWRSSTTRRRT